MTADYWPYLAAFLASLIGTGLKAFQQKNIIGDHFRLVVLTSYFIAIADVTSIGLIAHNGWTMFLPVGTGAGIGMVFGMKFHTRFIKKNLGRKL